MSWNRTAPLRIAQVAPLWESVPPKLYGGTERVVAYLTEALVAQGHDVTLFASGDSVTSAKLVATTPRALRLGGCADGIALHLAMLEEVYRRRSEFDVVHFHVDYLHFPITQREHITHVTTLHNRLDVADLMPLFHDFEGMPLVSISDSQRAPLPHATWVRTVHHGLPIDIHRPGRGGDYLAFLGRICPEKGIVAAIEIAKRSHMPLRIAAKIGEQDRAYHEREVMPLLADPLVEFVGEIGERGKQEFLAGARALVFPIDWPEPFGMVMIEALACGTPIIAFPRGSVPEIVEHGVTGFLCDDVDEAVRAVARVPELSREVCRAAFERRFTADRMARDYVEVYRRLIDARRDHPDRGPLLHSSDQLPRG
ncbi:MAG TPA: glycosyltransferase family 4 protein [Polyangiaceae bacterium]|jgi:glycosyltransferase involved in cell wall biosynthesis